MRANKNHRIVSQAFKTSDGRKYVQLESGARRRTNDDGSLYERPGKAELKRRKRARQTERQRSNEQPPNDPNKRATHD